MFIHKGNSGLNHILKPLEVYLFVLNYGHSYINNTLYIDPAPIPQDAKQRSRTAPNSTRRKGWVASSVHIKTQNGDDVHFPAPAVATGEYQDDFIEDSECCDTVNRIIITILRTFTKCLFAGH